jgi:hypothetical protein
MKKNILIIISVVVLLAVGGGSFYAGMIFGKSQDARPSFSGENFPGGVRQGQNGTAGAGLVTGSILSKDATSITLQLPNNGGSKIIFYSGDSQISTLANGSAEDLAAGTSVTVTGTTNTDGSVTAKTIQIRPAIPTGQSIK